MTKDAELLSALHKTAEMGKNTLDKVTENMKDGNMKEYIEFLCKDYAKLYDITEQKLRSRNEDVKDINSMLKLMSRAMINMKINETTTETEIAEMVIEGSVQGVVKTTRVLKDYEDCEEDIKSLAYRLLYVENRTIESMKRYL